MAGLLLALTLVFLGLDVLLLPLTFSSINEAVAGWGEWTSWVDDRTARWLVPALAWTTLLVAAIAWVVLYRPKSTGEVVTPVPEVKDRPETPDAKPDELVEVMDPAQLADAIQRHGDDCLTRLLRERAYAAPGRPEGASAREYHGPTAYANETLARYAASCRSGLIELLTRAQALGYTDTPHLSRARAPESVGTYGRSLARTPSS